MRRAVLIVSLAAGCLALAPAAPFAAQAEQTGPPLSAAPPKPAPPPAYAPPAQAPPHSAAGDEATYDRCLNLAKSDPGAARDLAEHWQSRGGAHPADHCYAVALIGLKQYKEGAAKLEALAQAMTRAPNSLRAEVLDQASQAWLLAGDPARAYAAGTAALGLLPDDPDILIDRAEAAGSEGSYDKALADLNRVLKIDPGRADALVYRATAYRGLGKLDEALADADRAVDLSPNSVAALLERGDIRRLKGDVDGARKDWVRVSELAPGSDADAQAKTNIERLELKEDTGVPAKK
jgi:tetratricopeptide (TPR) repeat protein